MRRRRRSEADRDRKHPKRPDELDEALTPDLLKGRRAVPPRLLRGGAEHGGPGGAEARLAPHMRAGAMMPRVRGRTSPTSVPAGGPRYCTRVGGNRRDRPWDL